MHYQNQKRDCTEEGVRETEKEISTLVHTRKGSIAKEGKGIERLHKNIHYNQSISSMFNYKNIQKLKLEIEKQKNRSVKFNNYVRHAKEQQEFPYYWSIVENIRTASRVFSSQNIPN